MAHTLVQALEGIAFPCDRSRIMDYARTNNAESRALDLLEQIPEQQYRSMTELLTALPSKRQRRTAIHTPAPPAGEPAPVAPEPQGETLAEAGPAAGEAMPEPLDPVRMAWQWQSWWLDMVEDNLQFYSRLWSQWPGR